MLSASVVVGRPISLLSVWLSSKSPPLEAPISESASISARPAGRPTALQRGSKIRFAEILVGDRLSALFAEFSRQFAQRPAVVARQFIHLARMALFSNHFRCRRGIVCAGGRGNVAFACRTNKHAVFQRRRRARQIVFGIPAVAQQGIRNA